mgnify:CR=1 FL=1
MDMYQKRKARAEKKNNNVQGNSTTVSLNWLITIYLNLQTNPYK